MLAWFGELNPGERRTMGACFGGWALDAFDVQMYSFVIPTVIALWGVSRGEGRHCARKRPSNSCHHSPWRRRKMASGKQ